MARGTRTIYPVGGNESFSSKFQSPEKGRSIKRPEYREHDNKDEDNCPNYVDNVNNNILFSFSRSLTFFPFDESKVLQKLSMLFFVPNAFGHFFSCFQGVFF